MLTSNIRPWLLFLTGLSALLCGCDIRPYSVEPQKDGSTLVLNKWTGSVSKVADEIVVELGKFEESSRTRIISFREYDIPKQPYRFAGRGSYTSNGMVLKFSVKPADTPKTQDEWDKWRSQLARSRLTAHIQLHFQDSGGFDVMNYGLDLSDLSRVVDDQDNYVGLNGQLDVPMSISQFARVKQWSLTWRGFQTVEEPPPDPAQKN